MRSLRVLPLLSALAVTIGLVPSLSAASASAPGDDHHHDHALQALGLAQGLLSAKTPEQALGQLTGHPTASGGYGGAGDKLDTSSGDASMALRDLARSRTSLRGAERRTADRLLSRPSSNRSKCATGPDVCIHWSSKGANKATPTYAKQVLGVVQHVMSKYQHAGYRRPMKDGNKYFDVYLQDVASQGLYGYTTTTSAKRRSPAYLVLDNNYSASQYPSKTPGQNLRVTAAHEFFHAVQFNYDANEDVWLMEATAVWAEDQIYDGINDNRQYLPYGQLRKPKVPLDSTKSPNMYGNWLFFTYLSMRMPKQQGGLSTIVRSVWGHATKTYSTKAMDEAVDARGLNLKRIYGKFNAVNQHPKVNYAEAKAGHYKAAPHATVKFTASTGAKSGSWSVDHLSSRAVRFVPKNTPKGKHLTLSVDRSKGAQAVAWINTYYKSGKVTMTSINGGKGTKSFPFGSNKIRGVDIVFSNTGHRTRDCQSGGPFACNGKSKDQNRTLSWKAHLS